jgi:hypothetical protein
LSRHTGYLVASTPLKACVRFASGCLFGAIFQGEIMRILGMTSLLALSAAITATVTMVPIRSIAADCPTEKRQVCIQETIAGHTLKHEATTKECLIAKWGSDAKILNEGDCASH